MKLSIIIISYNTEDLLKNCISSIISSIISFDYEIIVVDNHSTDGSLEMLKTNFPQVKVIANKENLLFAKANNQGATIAKGEYLLLLNSDTIVYGDNINRLVSYFETLGQSVICVGSKILNEDGSIQSQGFTGLSHWATITKHFKLGVILPSFIGKRILPPGTYPFNRNELHEVAWVSGACMLIRSDLYHKVGGLNENLEFYGEEPEFGFRTSKQGFKTVYYPYAEIIHLGGKSTSKSFKKIDDALRRYAVLVKQTVGYSYAIWTSRITKTSYCLKYLLTFRGGVLELINKEILVIKYLKQLNRKK